MNCNTTHYRANSSSVPGDPTADGQLAGHYALERDEPGPVAEGGQAVVDPAHRSRGLLDRLKDAALAEARRLQFVGVFADAVTAHTRTQQSDFKHGAHLTCVDLAIVPQSISFKKISTDLPQRLTCTLFFQWLSTPTPRTIFVPERHRAMIERIYQNLACPFTIGPADPSQAAAHGTLQLKIASPSRIAFIRAEQIGVDAAHLIHHAKREVIEHSHVEVVYAELPLDHPATPSIADQLETTGFAFLGVAPAFAPNCDILRMAYLIDPLERDPIKTADPFTAELVDYTLAEQRRVRAAL